MKIYAISGLGADQRVFNFLKLEHELIPIQWIRPMEKEPIRDYSLRLSEVIDTNSNFGLLGVSFGGLVAVEISKILNPKFTILISSAETKDELRLIYRTIGQLGVLNKLPLKAFDPPRLTAQFVFGTHNKKLLTEILDETDLDFAKWAVIELINWKNLDRIDNLIRIHGTHDKLIPLKSTKTVKLINGGEHFMIVDRAEEISEIINEEIKTHHNII